MDLKQATDERLLRAKRARVAGEAFAEFYRRYERAMLAYFARRGWSPEAAADHASTTFAEALAARSRFRDRGEGSAVAWLYGVARHVHLRQRRVEDAGLRRDDRLLADHRVLSDHQRDAITRLVDDAPLLAALADLPPAQREAVFAYVVADEPYEDIAERTGVDEAAVRQRVSRGLRALRTAQEKENR